MTTARLLTILALSLPLAACAAQPAAQAPRGAAPADQAASTGQDGQAGSAAVVPAPAPAAAPAARQAAPDSAQAPAQTRSATPSDQPRRAAGATGVSSAARGAGAPAAGTPAAGTPAAGTAPAPSAAAPAAQPSTVPAPAANAPAIDPASPTAPDTTVGGGAANRPAPAAAPAPMPATSATGSLLQTLLALIVVLGVLGALAWFLKRYGPKAGGGSANLRVVGALNLGGRERVLVVEVGNQWIVVGASPGRINALATMPKQEGMDTGAGAAHATLAPHTQPANSFADWLKQTIDKRK
jgi:flagellar biosynthetic protein FliO